MRYPVGLNSAPGMWDIHWGGNIARWMGIALQTLFVILSNRDVENLNNVPGAKSDAPEFRPKNDCPSLTIAQVILAHTSLV